MRVALGVEYDGTDYCGWEYQKHCASVQEALEGSLANIADEPIRTVCAGRTDAGVHAWDQVVHFDTTASRDTKAWVRGTNSRLPSTVKVRWAKLVDENFHARFSALQRHYCYLILNTPVPSALLRTQVTWQREPLDHDLMHRAAQALCGEHDFSAYRASGCQSVSPIRTVYKISVTRHGSVVRLDINANAFLQHMVRNIAGVLITIGNGKASPYWAEEVLAGRDRSRGGITARSSGLHLMKVLYPAHFVLPALAVPTPLVLLG